MPYDFNHDVSTDRWDIKIDVAAKYGYTERHSDGTGGGLWFAEREGHPGQLELIDYDGMACLPKSVVAALRGAGYYLDDTHDD